MTFLNPLVLLGLAAAAIPLLLHLLNLRKLKTIEFSTLRFIKELQKTQIRKLKLQQILLLILRTLIIIFAVLAFARPVIKSDLPVFGSHVKTSVVILLDNSFSMDVSDEGGNRLKQAKNIAQQVVAALKDGDEAVIIASSDAGEQKKISFSSNFSLLKEEIQKLPLSATTAEMSSLIRMASAMLGQSNNVNKEIYLISDAQKNIFEGKVDSVRVALPSATVFALPVGIRSRIAEQNLSVDSLAVLTRIFQAAKPVELEAFIRNNSQSDAKGVVVSLLFNGTRVAQRTVDIPAGQVRTASIAAPPQGSGAISASVEIEGDGLESDNRRYFGFVIPPKPNVALVGSPEQTRFLSLVLQSEAGSEVANVRVMSAQQFAGANSADYEVAVIAGGLGTGDIPRIESYVKNGGGVLLFADNNADPATAKNILRTLGLGEPVDASFTANQPAQFSSTDKLHPLFQGVFKGTTDGRAVVESPKMTRALPATGGQHIIQMQVANLASGAFLSESRLGEGRALYCAVPPTTAWSNFPLTGVFPVIVFRSIVYAASREQLGAEVVAGQSYTLALPKRHAAGGSFKVIDPARTESFRQAVQLPGGATLGLGILKQPGVFSIASSSGQTVATVAVNPPAGESTISVYDKDEFKKAIAQNVEEKTPIEVLDATQNVSQSVARARIGTELWKLFVILAIVCALAEMIVARLVKTEA